MYAVIIYTQTKEGRNCNLCTAVKHNEEVAVVLGQRGP